MSSPTPHRFGDPIWTIRDVLGWILDRDPAKFGRLFTDRDIQSARHQLLYSGRPRPEYDPHMLKTLLHALQRGDVVAYDETNPVARDFWTDKTLQYVRDSTGFRIRREDVLALCPDLRGFVSRAPRPIRPLQPRSGGVDFGLVENESRLPNWQIWKSVPEVTLYEAVALSLNIAPEKLRWDPDAWTGGKHLKEGEEFEGRLSILKRNLPSLQSVNHASAAVRGTEPFICLQEFAARAASFAWSLPAELVELANSANARSPHSPSEAAIAPKTESKTPLQPGAVPKPTWVHIPSKREAVAAWIVERYPDGIPPGMTT